MTSTNSLKPFLLVLGFFVLFMPIQAQESTEGIPFEDLPPTNEFGKCYAKCKMPAEYKWVESQKLVKEASVRYQAIPAQYKTVEDRMLVKEASTKQIPVPAVYETITERVMVKEAATRVEEIPSQYRTETERILVEPARGEWIKKKSAENCFSENPEDCYVMCYEEKPAVYKTVSKQVVSRTAQTRTVDIPAEYKTVTKRILKTPASMKTVQIPAEYRTVSKRVLVKAAERKEIAVPAVYTTHRERTLVNAGGYTTWNEILCTEKINASTIQRVQRALVSKGFNPGPSDGVLGYKTKVALRKYQETNSLPIGNLNIQTLKHLGIQG